MIAAHHSMMGGKAPTVFRYIAIKVVACRGMRNSTASAWKNKIQMVQISEVQFYSRKTSIVLKYPSGMTISHYTAYNGKRYFSAPTLVSNYNSGEGVGRLFDFSSSTKWATYQTNGFSDSYAPVIDYDTGEVLMAQGRTYDDAFIAEHFGAGVCPTPVALVLDLGAGLLDLANQTRWKFINGNDNRMCPERTWIEGEILGSADGRKWWRLDVFNDPTIKDINRADAYYGNLVPRKGDLWSDLDLADRDWANGIAVDNI